MVTGMTKGLIVAGIILLFFHFAGLLPNTLTSNLINLFINPESIDILQLGVLVKLALTTGIIGGAISIGSFITGKTELAVKVGVATLALNFAWDSIELFRQLSTINIMLATIVAAPLTIIIVLATIEWVTGSG